MKIEEKTIREILDKARAQSLRPVDDSILMKDMNDKFFNFGVDHMFYVVIEKLYEIVRYAKGVEL